MEFLRLSYDEARWLKHRGGRTIEDVFVDDDGRKYIYMGNGDGTDRRVYMPKELEDPYDI